MYFIGFLLSVTRPLPRCLVYTGCMAVCPEETANRVFQRSLSIPITMRAVINQVVLQKVPSEGS